MGFYNDLISAGNTSGAHTFDAVAFDILVADGVTSEKIRDQQGDGEVVKLREAGKDVAECLVHFNGKTKDITENTVLMDIQSLAKLSEAAQAKLRYYEILPGNTRHADSPIPPRVRVDNKDKLKAKVNP